MVFKEILKNLSTKPITKQDPFVLNRAKHQIREDWIDPDALWVAQKLIEKGFEAFLVGGCVRDMLVEKKCKDFDVVSNARPNQIKKIFKNCWLVGKRFRLAHIVFKRRKIIEVSTFRKEEKTGNQQGEIIKSDNLFGTAVDDMFKRDLTINALLLHPIDFSIFDYTGGLRDISTKMIRIVGDPGIRFGEDPIRVLRALRFAGKLDFKIESNTMNGLLGAKKKIWSSALPRILEEIHRALRCGGSERVFKLWDKHGIFEILLPGLGKVLKIPKEKEIFWKTLKGIDGAIQAGERFLDEMLYLLFFFRLVGLAGNNPFSSESNPAELENAFEKIFTPFAIKFKVARRIRSKTYLFFAGIRRMNRWGERGSRPHRFVHMTDFPKQLVLFEILAKIELTDSKIVTIWKNFDPQKTPVSGGKGKKKGWDPGKNFGPKRRNRIKRRTL